MVQSQVVQSAMSLIVANDDRQILEDKVGEMLSLLMLMLMLMPTPMRQSRCRGSNHRIDC
jgi:hypothetical protein